MLGRVGSVALLPVIVSGLLLPMAASAVNIDWVTVGDPGNAADDNGFGAVTTTYQISKYEVTNSQYAEFLNAVAAADPHSLYNPDMGNPTSTGLDPAYGGITRNGSSGSFSYQAIVGREDMPVNHVSWYDALRFSNWLHNGQPIGPPGAATTEGGAYTITAAGIAANSIVRNAGATIFLTNGNEWYKAAYFDGTSYFDYPAATDSQTACASPGGAANTANCDTVVGDLTAVGSYTGSASPNGTYDQGGNVWEWNEDKVFTTPFRHVRGGSFIGIPSEFAASLAVTGRTSTIETANTGFRVAGLVPEPNTGLLLAAGLVGLAMQRRKLH